MASETKSAVKFGTDGWRGIIADDFTYANVRVAAAAIANYVLAHEDAKAGVCIGYDTRFGSRSFAKVVAEVLALSLIHISKSRPDNSEYPWLNGKGEVQTPCLFSFSAIFDNRRTMIQLIQVVRRAARMYSA